MTTHRTSGFSLIEVILVLALVGVVALFSMSFTLDSLSRSAAAGERDLFVSLLLRGARAAAIANIKEKSHGIYINDTDKEYVLFEGQTVDENPSTNRTIPFTNDTLSVSNTGGDTIVFDQLSGDVITGAGTITLANSVKSSEIIIRSTGQIDW